MTFHVKHRLAACLALVLAACGVPEDELFSPTAVEPVQVAPGVYRMTFNSGPDLVRGFSADGGAVLYRSRGPDSSEAWRILAAPVEGGPVSEEAALYRAAITSSVASLTARGNERVMAVWSTPLIPTFSCPCFPPDSYPSVTGLTFYWLGERDGRALAALPVHSSTLRSAIRFDSTDAVNGIQVFGDTVRLVIAQQVIRSLPVNPFGPTLSADGAEIIYSDGETLWRVARDSPGVRDSLGPGAFPALSADGRWLAAVVPVQVDSTATFCVQALDPTLQCHQRLFTHTTLGWQARLYDLAGDSTVIVGAGLEAVPDMNRSRVLVRRFDGLYWVQLPGRESRLVTGTGGAYAIAMSPREDAVAFTADRFQNPDVFLLVVE